MSKISIQWSNHANKANGLGRAMDEKGRFLASSDGYIGQAFAIATGNLYQFKPEDIRKASRICGEHFPGLAIVCDSYLTEKGL